MPDALETLPRVEFERMIAEATCELADGDWQAIRQMVVMEWEAAGVAAWVIEPLRRCDPRASPIVRRKAFDLATTG